MKCTRNCSFANTSPMSIISTKGNSVIPTFLYKYLIRHMAAGLTFYLLPHSQN